MSFQSRIPSPSKANEPSQGTRPVGTAKRLLPQPHSQASLKLDDSNITKPLVAASGSISSRLEAAKSAREVTGGSGRNVVAHARGASTSAATKTKPSVTTQRSGDNHVSQIARTGPKGVEKAQITPTAPQHKRTLSAFASTRATAPHQNTDRPDRPKSKPIGRATKNSGNAASANVPTMPRPNFDTYKQHFSPQKAKQPPAPVVTSNHPVSTNASGVGPSEILRFNDELLQLSLVHKGSAAALQEYTNNITSHSEKQYGDLERQHRQLHLQERDRQARDNLRGVRKWINANSGGDDAGFDPLSVLAECALGLEDIARENGAFSVAMEQFNDWEVRAHVATAGRADPEETRIQFVTPLSLEWKGAIESIEQRLGIFLTSLRVFGKSNEEATIGAMITTLSELAELLLQQILMCKRLEGLILQRQQQWIDTSIEKALMAVNLKGLQNHQSSQRRGIWEVVED